MHEQPHGRLRGRPQAGRQAEFVWTGIVGMDRREAELVWMGRVGMDRRESELVWTGRVGMYRREAGRGDVPAACVGRAIDREADGGDVLA